MESTLFDETDTDHRPDPAERRRTRLLALGGALQLLRTGRGWNVNDAASAANVAPMTWRRLEEGQAVRRRTHVAVDVLLDQPFGTVERAVADDVLMLNLVAHLGAVDRASVTDDDAGDVLAAYTQRLVTGSTRPVQTGRPSSSPRPGSGWPVVDPATSAALAALSQHVPACHPTELELVQRTIERLVNLHPTPAIDALVKAALEALPDLIAHQVHAACVELPEDPART